VEFIAASAAKLRRRLFPIMTGVGCRSRSSRGSARRVSHATITRDARQIEIRGAPSWRAVPSARYLGRTRKSTTAGAV